MDNTGHSDAVGSDVERVSQWIPVTERLPQERVCVLTWDGYQRCLEDYTQSDGWGLRKLLDSFAETPAEAQVTHWMPLPNPPRS